MNNKINIFEGLILSASALLVILNSPLVQYIHPEKKKLYISMITVFSFIAVAGLILVIIRLIKNHKIIGIILYDSADIIKSNYTFFVLSYLVIFFVSGKLFDTKMEILVNMVQRLVHGNLRQKIQIISYTIIVAPVMEELFFRRFLFRILRRMNISWLIFISSALFMISHDNTDISKLVIGIGLARIYIKYDRIELNIIVHSAINCISILFGTMISLWISDTNVNYIYFLLPMVFILPNYKYLIGKILLENPEIKPVK